MTVRAKIPVEISLETPLAAVAGLNARQRSAFRSLGLLTVRDLVFHFPFRHEDFTKVTTIRQAPRDEHVTLIAQVVGVKSHHSFRRRGLNITEAALYDGTGKLKAIWFNQPYLAKMLKTGSSYRFAGKIVATKYGPTLTNPLFELDVREESAYAAPLVPVYNLAAGVSQHVLRRLLNGLRLLMAAATDPLPAEVRQRYRLEPLGAALIGIHFPRQHEELAAARRRLAFDEMFRLQLLVSRMRHFRTAQKAAPVPFDEAATREFVGSLPFKLTDDQRRAAWEILQDMSKKTPMHRLLDGDVGSGKTVVAAIAALNAARAGYQTAIMAPTEILAKQHYDSLTRLLKEQGIGAALWTNAYKRSGDQRSKPKDGRRKTGEMEPKKTTAAETRKLAEMIAGGEIAVVVGTHALAEESFRFGRLALAVIDEQHRFGVGVRQTLCKKSGLPDVEPHLLSMTATPIPRSLALTFYGDLDLSLLKQKPKDRKRIITRIAGSRERAAAYDAIRREIAAGHQAFFVCPQIDASDEGGSLSVTEAFARLSRGPFADIEVGMLHGQMKPDEKERTMADFAAGKTKVLVSTSVIEVGVDVPNATVMAIEGAERFGLAQLHQFRGRVGRSEAQSYCWLFPSNFAPQSLERLRAVVQVEDGFSLAEKDLALRGPGDLMGREQSGFPPFRIATFGDVDLIRDTREAASRVLDADPELKSPAWQAYLPVSERDVHLE